MASGLIEQIAAGEAPSLVPLTVDQLHVMLDKGILRDGEPIELVEGLLVRKNRAAAGEDAMTPGTSHARAVTRLARLDRSLDPFDCHARVQLPVTLSALSEPEPDLAIVRGSIDAFAKRHPGPADILVLVEVADSSLGYDRGTKLRVYAAAGVAAYVIANIPDRQIEFYEGPVPEHGRYRERTDYRGDDTILLPLGPGRTLPLRVADVF